MNLVANRALTSIGHRLDTSAETFGELRDSGYLMDDAQALRMRMEEDGYLYLRGFFRREDVLAARAEIVGRLVAEGVLMPGTDPMDAIIMPGGDSYFRPDLTANNAPLHHLLYGERMMNLYRDYFSEAVRHYDFTWLRAVGPGKGSAPHCDMVYMGRGAREKLLTAWVPLGDASRKLGGLMVLEGSHRKHDRLRNYLERDVDTYCTNGRHAAQIESGAKQWEWNGSLSKNPASLRAKLGGRWLTTDFEAGDLLTFTMHTVHGSLDNSSGDRIRFSSDSRYQPASLPADERWIGENPVGHGLAGKRGRIC